MLSTLLRQNNNVKENSDPSRIQECATSATVYVKFYAQVLMDFTLAAQLDTCTDRIKEHFENIKSSVYKHLITCHKKTNNSKSFISVY